MQAILRKLGWVSSPPHRTIIVTMPSAADCAEFGWLIDGLAARNSRLGIYFLASDQSTARGLAEHFGRERVLTHPWNTRANWLVFLLTSRARLVLALRSAQSIPVLLVKEAYSLGI